ncbi:MAG: hypothetical protein EP330_05800 [Deltaproteobacteria bacterium]|nr:MAG: hypothetical protein EP330_05800 [Deltaproteobacteria bacterium]
MVLTLGATLALGGVHAPVRAALCVAIAGWSLFVLRYRRHMPQQPDLVRLYQALAAALVLGLLVLVPLPMGLRAMLSPQLTAIEAVVGADGWRPLAPDPGAALRGLAVLTTLWLAMQAAVHRQVRPRHLVLAVTAAGAVTAGLGIASMAVGLASPLGLGRGVGVTWFGTFISANHAGALLAAGGATATFAAVSDKRWRPLWVSLAVLCAVGAVLSRSRGAPMHLLIGLALGLAAQERGPLRVLGLGVAVAVPLAVVSMPEAWLEAYSQRIDPGHLNNDVFGGRGAFYRDAAALSGVSPLLGLGAGGFAVAFRSLFDTPRYVDFQHAHNEWLQLPVEQGAFGVFLVAVAIALWLRSLRGEPAHDFVGASVAGLGALASAATIDFPARSLALALVATWLFILPFKRSTERAPRVRFPVFAVLGAAAVLAFAVGGPYGRASAAMDLAQAEFDAGDLVAAEEQVEQALARRPLDARAWGLRARIAQRGGDLEAAKAHLEASIAVAPHLPGPWIGLARLRRATGDAAGADAAYGALLELELPAGSEKALIAEVIEQGPDATVRALQMWPTRPDRQCQMAIDLARRGAIDDGALLMTEEARELCRQPWAEWLVANKQYQAALDELGELRGCVADRTAGRALLALERPEALGRLEEAMLACEDKPLTLRVALGQAKLRAGDRDGLGVLEGAVRDHPDATWARQVLVRELTELGLAERAAEHRRWLEKP